MTAQLSVIRRRFVLPILIMIGVALGVSDLTAQCAGEALACNNLVHVSLDTNCIAVITPDVILENEDADTSLYRVEVRDPDGNIIDTIRQDYNGALLEVRVFCKASVQPFFCWGFVKIEDKIPPVINVEPCDTAVTCFVFPFDLEPNSLVTKVTFSDNGCEKPDSLGITDVVETQFVCGDTVKIIERFWTVVDAAGNHASKKQTIYLLRGTIDQLEFPRDTVVDCLDEADLSIEALGMPLVRSCENYEITHEDVEIPVCGVARKILRRWRVTDLCTPRDTTVTQVIKIEDNNAPTIDFSEFQLPVERLEAQKRNCLADARDIPNPIITDCNLAQTTLSAFFQLVDQNGNLTGQRFPAIVNDLETFDLVNVPIDEPFRIIFVADDGCGNISRDTSGVLTAVDTQPPNAICEGSTNITLNEEDGEVEVLATSFDDHSFDNCGIEMMQIRRFNETTFSDRIRFDCDDVANSPVKVVFRVFDKAGLFSDCVVDIHVQDKRRVVLSCLPDRSFNCDVTEEEVRMALEAEEPTSTESCGIVSQILDIPDYTLSECGSAQFTVVWTAIDANGLTSTCSRLITIGDMTLATVTRPTESQFSLDSCSASIDPADIPGSEPIINNVDCENIATSFEDQFFFGEQDACVKILRQWSVIDWCRFNGGSFSSALIDSFTQTIVISDNVVPTFVSDMMDITVADNDRNCEEMVSLIAQATDDCTPEDSLKYSYVIDMFNTGSEDKIGATNDASGVFPVGTHRIIFMAEDMCGNIGQAVFLFTVASQKEPLVFLINSSTLTLGDNGIAELSAAALNASSSNGCLRPGVTTDDTGLIYSFDANGSELTRAFTCSDIPNGRSTFLTLNVWVTDSVGNTAFAPVSIGLDDTADVDQPEGVCPDVMGSALLSGVITTEDQISIPNVPVTAIQSATGVILESTTDDFGQYTFDDAILYEDYKILPSIDGYDLAGVSTLDIVLIQQHILGLKSLETPYKMVAADANGSGNISGIDLVELRHLILGRSTELSTTGWKFVDSNDDLEMEDPFFYRSEIIVNEAEERVADLDFIALKVGDVSGNAFEVLAQIAKPRSTETLDVRATRHGDVIRYAIHATGEKTLRGIQFGIDLPAGSNLLAIGSDQLSLSDEHWHLSGDELRVSWSGDGSVNVGDQALLMFDIAYDGEDVPLLSMSSHIDPEMYNADFETKHFALEQQVQDIEYDQFKLHQNVPNPFGFMTSISFELHRAGTAQLSISDLNGRVIYELSGLYPSGMNTIDISVDELRGSGVYYYTLASGGHSETGRMIVLQ
ncbi:MAG: T9SS type A sorting domain-containing protein [Bacteroidota bacterium]